MNRRFLLAIFALVLLVVSAGCLAYFTGGGEVSDERLDREPADAYQWETDRDVHIDLRTSSSFQAVYQVEAGETLRLYRSTGYGTEEALDISAVRFRYADNETVISGTELKAQGGEVEQTPDEVYVTAPDADGRLAFTASAIPRRFTLPVYAEGSYEVVLPPGNRIDFFLFGNVAPRGYESEVIDDRTRVYWDDVDSGTVLVQYYGERDLYIFGAVVALLSVVAVGGLLHYRRKIDDLADKRRAMGLGVNEDDEDDRSN
ncbi:DUF5803 family protein [Haloferacaceae archaeon DSL9]